MNFLYANNGDGVLSSLLHSGVFWLVLLAMILVTVAVVVFYRRGAQRTGDALHARPSDEEIHQKLLDDLQASADGGRIPDRNKTLGDSLDQGEMDAAAPLHIDDPEKRGGSPASINVRESRHRLFKLGAGSTLRGFQAELSQKQRQSAGGQKNELRLYNDGGACIVVLRFSGAQLHVSSVSPFMGDSVSHIGGDVIWMDFRVVGTKLYLDQEQVALFRLYDRVAYVRIDASIIKRVNFI